ncbi:hypothetical protein ONS96_010501 [Cadophora gregata f. sp. sojae]|nr:hypothetical protein ONS96_010501 [Cadophora gregata f. sp. sojae]
MIDCVSTARFYGFTCHCINPSIHPCIHKFDHAKIVPLRKSSLKHRSTVLLVQSKDLKEKAERWSPVHLPGRTSPPIHNLLHSEKSIKGSSELQPQPHPSSPKLSR